jgi:hypothetical protein
MSEKKTSYRAAVAGYVASRWQAIPRVVRFGTLGNLVLFASVSGFNAVVLPWIGAADSRFHMRYMLAVWHGTLPADHSIVSAHPPFYYALFAPIVGPLLEEEHFTIAVVIVRAANIVFGAICLLVLAWAGWNLSSTRKAAFAIAVPGLAGLITPYIRVVGDTYNDGLATLFATSALAIAIVMIKRGVTRGSAITLAVVSVLGMSTRATFVVTFGLALIALIAAVLLHGSGTRFARFKEGAASAIAIGLIVVAAIGWFYVFNMQRSGSWFRSHPAAPFAARDYASLTDNLTNPDFYLVTIARLLGFRDWVGMFPFNGTISIAISAICGIGLVFWLLTRRRWKSILSKRTDLLIAILLILQMLGLYAMQLQHATGWGNINLRYFLPGLLVFGVVMAIGALQWRRLRGQLVTVLMAVLGAGAALDVVWFSSPMVRHVPTQNPLTYFPQSVIGNGLPVAVVVVLVVGMIGGLLIAGASLFRATAEGPIPRRTRAQDSEERRQEPIGDHVDS